MAEDRNSSGSRIHTLTGSAALPPGTIGPVPLVIRVASRAAPPSWGSRVTAGFGGMTSRPENLQVSSWPSVPAGRHRPRDPLKIGKLGCRSLPMPGAGLGFSGSSSRGTSSSHPSLRAPHFLHPFHPGLPPQGPRCPHQGLLAGA